MAYVYKRGYKWYIGFRDNRGGWRAKATSARSKTEAKRLADELGFNHERQRLGLEPLPSSDGGGTLAELLRWWLMTYSAKSPSHDRNKSTIEKHLVSAISVSFGFRRSHRPSSRRSSRKKPSCSRLRR